MALTDRACSSCQSALPADAQFCMRCGTATPTEPGVPPRTQSTGAFEVAQVTQALAGRYKIERVLGEGGMATVYLAEDLKHQRQVAVKVMRPELAATLGADRFLREVQIAAKLNHPNILTMHDSGAADGLLYYVMPYVEGETLKDRLVRDGALPPEEALRLAREIAEALGYAHKRGIVHRDIKPANILLNEGHALIADFGIARAVEDGGESLTRTGLAVGTPQYMAPEQATGEKAIDGRADIYATGAILYEMLAGQTPFTGSSARAILTKSLTEKPAPLPQVRPGLAPILDTVVQKALAKGVEERYASATEFVAAIDAARTPSSASQEAMPAVQATQVVAAAPAARGFGGLLSARNLIIAGLAAVALFFALRGRGAAPSPAANQPRGNRLAVLPFRNEGLPVNAAVTDGVVEDLRRRLGNVSALTVIGASSVSEYRNTDKSPATIGQDLKVDYLLTGTVRWDGEGTGRRAAMDTRLLDSRSGEELWGETVTVADAELPVLPIKAAKGVLAALAVTPSSVELARVDSPLTRNAEAYRSYVRGQQAYLNETIDGPGLRGVIQELEQAVAIDAQFGDAWTLLSRANAFLFLNGNRDPANAARARQALERAEALQPGAPSVHAAKAGYLLAIAADAPAASAELDLALRGAPNDARLLRQSGASDLGRGDLGSALTKLERTRELDPRDPSTLASLVQVYVNLGRAAEAKEIGATLLAVAPLDLINVSQVVKAYLSDGDVA
ncbi:MAG TPA: protein kinase, partial [Gemmatimonadales bacterium]|nr:protein kinase [Gemmatimonadales bacterium]